MDIVTHAAGAAFAALQVGAPAGGPSTQTSCAAIAPEGYTPSAAHRWLDTMLETAAREVVRVGARPTILSRQLAIVQTAVFDAWAAYDPVAGVSRLYGGYHIAGDNAEGLQMGREVSAWLWPVIQSYFDGSAKINTGLGRTLEP